MRITVVLDIETEDVTREEVEAALVEELDDFEFYPPNGSAAIYRARVVEEMDDFEANPE